MARTSRQISQTGFYHVMMRGNEKREIFKDDRDREKLLGIIREKKKEVVFDLYGYCLMNNHVHLLIRTENIAGVMKRINTSYACFFNKKYNRVGHLFQDRFKSETIDDEKHLMAVVRYIHNNPYQAGMVSDILEYPWSSYIDYVSKRDNKNNDLVDTWEILSLFSQEKNKAIEYFKEFSNKENDDQFIDIKEDDSDVFSFQETDNSLVVEKYLKDNNLSITDLKTDCNRHYLQEVILNLRKKTQLSIRGIANLLGFNRGIVQRMVSQKPVAPEDEGQEK
ncbi:MAG: hypothetical protein VR72_08080 [Clostridiaceae bacterium BRH_c20a]|nr:MAG: hypothetical protein VR72_08080 [Clostridiaceae bacterium BRH_c20a]